MKFFATITFTFAAVAIAAEASSRTLTLEFTIRRGGLVKTVKLTFTTDETVKKFYNGVVGKTNTGKPVVAIKRDIFFQDAQLAEFRDAPEDCATTPLEANIVQSSGGFTKTTIFEEMNLDFCVYGHTTKEIGGFVDVGQLFGLDTDLYLQKKETYQAVVPQDAIPYAVLSYKPKSK